MAGNPEHILVVDFGRRCQYVRDSRTDSQANSFYTKAQTPRSCCKCRTEFQVFTLTHWGWVTHICVGNLTIIDLNNGLSPGGSQVIICTNAEIMLIEPFGIIFSEILSKCKHFHSRKCVWKSNIYICLQHMNLLIIINHNTTALLKWCYAW